jgi:tripartite-type tricarboxylate transporter receptor subunit TctC
MTNNRLAAALLGLIVAMTTTGQTASAQNYPSRSVKVVVPYPAGGPIDVIGRLLAQNLSKTLGGQFYVENVVGAGGTIGIRFNSRHRARG